MAGPGAAARAGCPTTARWPSCEMRRASLSAGAESDPSSSLPDGAVGPVWATCTSSWRSVVSRAPPPAPLPTTTWWPTVNASADTASHAVSAARPSISRARDRSLPVAVSISRRSGRSNGRPGLVRAPRTADSRQGASGAPSWWGISGTVDGRRRRIFAASSRAAHPHPQLPLPHRRITRAAPRSAPRAGAAVRSPAASTGTQTPAFRIAPRAISRVRVYLRKMPSRTTNSTPPSR